MPSCAARLAEKNRFPLSVRCRLMPMKKPTIGGASSVTGIRPSLEPGVDGLHTPNTVKTSVRFEAVGVTIVLLNVLAHSERDFALCLLLRRHFQSHFVTNAGGVGFLHKDVDRKGIGHFQLNSCWFDVWVNPHL